MADVRFATLDEVLRHRAARTPERIAYTVLSDGDSPDGERILTHAALDRRARAIAVLLARNGIRKGDRVALLLHPGAAFLEGFFGCLYAGAVAVPVQPPASRRANARLEAIAADSNAAAALCAGALSRKQTVPSLREIDITSNEEDAPSQWVNPHNTGGDLVLLQYTSGSTGTPKGVALRHRNLLANLAAIRSGFGLTPDDHLVSWLPPYHDMGLIGAILQPLYTGFPAALMAPATFTRAPFVWLQAISERGATVSGAPNFAYELCARRITAEQRAALDLRAWRVAFCGAETIHVQTVERFAETFGDCGFAPESFIPCYGLAEATLFVSAASPSRRAPRVLPVDARALETELAARAPENAARRLVSCGVPGKGVDVLIVDPERGMRLPDGRVGEIWVGGPSVAAGYWNGDDETARVFGATLADGGAAPFLRTGDLGFIEGGELFVAGRIKDLIILRGRNIHPADVEHTIEASHVRVIANGAAAFSIDGDGAERLVVVAEVERRGTSDDGEVIAAVRAAVAEEHQVHVDAVVLVRAGTMLKTTSGKIRRSACRDAYRDGALAVIAEDATGGVAIETPLDDTPEGWLRAAVGAAIGRPIATIDPDRPLVELGLDSMMAASLTAAASEDLGITIGAAELLAGVTLRGLLASRQCAEHAQAGDAPSLTLAQERLWLVQRLDPRSAASSTRRRASELAPAARAATRSRSSDSTRNRRASRSSRSMAHCRRMRCAPRCAGSCSVMPRCAPRSTKSKDARSRASRRRSISTCALPRRRMPSERASSSRKKCACRLRSRARR